MTTWSNVGIDCSGTFSNRVFDIRFLCMSPVGVECEKGGDKKNYLVYISERYQIFVRKEMRMKQFHLFAFVFFCVMQPLMASAENAAEMYRLHQGDGLLVSVWGEASLSKEVRVLPDGSITFPLAGRIEVANLTTLDVEKGITEKLKGYFPEPQVTVVVISTEGSRAYILGKVLKPGPVPLAGPMTVLQALSMAGGLDKFADLGAVKILRAKVEGGQNVLEVNYDRLLRGQSLESNVLLQPGDTIVVP